MTNLPAPVGDPSVVLAVDGGALGIYDGAIIYLLDDGSLVNRFEGEDSPRERRVQGFMNLHLALLEVNR